MLQLKHRPAHVPKPNFGASKNQSEERDRINAHGESPQVFQGPKTLGKFILDIQELQSPHLHSGGVEDLQTLTLDTRKISTYSGDENITNWSEVVPLSNNYNSVIYCHQSDCKACRKQARCMTYSHNLVRNGMSQRDLNYFAQGIN